MELVNITNAITIKNGVASVSHIFIAEKTSNDKTSIKKLIEKHKNDFEKFGNVNFEFETIKAGRGTTKRKVYHLNEYQAYLLLTFLQNTKEVKNFKVWLISEFKKLRENKQPQPNLLGEYDEKLITELIKRSDIVRGYQGQIKALENELAEKQSKIKNLELEIKNLKHQNNQIISQIPKIFSQEISVLEKMFDTYYQAMKIEITHNLKHIKETDEYYQIGLTKIPKLERI